MNCVVVVDLSGNKTSSNEVTLENYSPVVSLCEYLGVTNLCLHTMKMHVIDNLYRYL